MRFDHYALYDEITEQLRAWTRKFPGMCRLSSIGKTREGRDIHLLTVTAGGDPAEKPGLLVDGNLHSGEVASSMAVMYILDRWLSAYKRDPEITRMLRENTVYAIPRINADAAEVYLTTPRTLRGSTEPYYPEESGLQPQDLDGDGEIRQMLVRNDAKKKKKCPDRAFFRETRPPLRNCGPPVPGRIWTRTASSPSPGRRTTRTPTGPPAARNPCMTRRSGCCTIS